MGEAAIVALAGALIGGLIGIVGTLWATRIQQRGEDRRATRPELRDLVVGLWADAQKAWKADQEVDRAHGEWWNSKEDPEKRANLDRAQRRWSEAQEAAWERLALLRITHPTLAESAEALLLTCRLLGDPEGGDDEEEFSVSRSYTRFFEARQAFERAAGEELRLDR